MPVDAVGAFNCEKVRRARQDHEFRIGDPRADILHQGDRRRRIVRPGNDEGPRRDRPDILPQIHVPDNPAADRVAAGIDLQEAIPDGSYLFREALIGFRGDGDLAQATSASIKEPSSAFPRLRAL
jgi:hypothetical protein